MEKNLREKIKKINSETKILATNAIKMIDEREISHDSFSFKSVPKHFIKISNGELDNLYNNQIENNLIDGSLYPKRIPEKEKIKIEKIRSNLLDIYRACKTNVYKIKLYKNILNNLSPLSILSEIKKEIELLKKEENFILIQNLISWLMKKLKINQLHLFTKKLEQSLVIFLLMNFKIHLKCNGKI